MITYEYPLIERVRTLLRLEDLFDRADYFLRKTEAPEHHVALLTLFEILEVAGRADLKSDLLQELERQKQMVYAFRDNPEVNQEALARVLHELESTYAALHAMTGKVGQHVRENDWLMSVRQRTTIPGGACEFDLPSYHYWLNQPAEERLQALLGWITPLYPIRDAVQMVLKLLRESGKPVMVRAHRGTFQQMMSGRSAQMVRLRVPRALMCIPEISANRYALNIRFISASESPRPRTCDIDIDFELTYCCL